MSDSHLQHASNLASFCLSHKYPGWPKIPSLCSFPPYIILVWHNREQQRHLWPSWKLQTTSEERKKCALNPPFWSPFLLQNKFVVNSVWIKNWLWLNHIYLLLLIIYHLTKKECCFVSCVRLVGCLPYREPHTHTHIHKHTNTRTQHISVKLQPECVVITTSSANTKYIRKPQERSNHCVDESRWLPFFYHSSYITNRL